MSKDDNSLIYEKLCETVFGFLTGGVYGLILAVIASYFLGMPFNESLIGWSAIVFAVIGFIRGNVVLEAFLALLHFFWGYVNGTYKPIVGHGNLEKTEPADYFKIIMWVGFATGLVVYLARRHYF